MRPHLSRLVLPLCLGLLGPIAPAHPATAGGQDPKKSDRQTLQEFLDRLKQMRDNVRAELTGTVDEHCRALELEAQVRHEKGCEVQRDKLVALGAEVAPLIVARLEPGANATDAQTLAAHYVAQALVQLPTRSITEALFAILKDGSLAGRRNALKVLAVTPEPERVVPIVGQFFRQAQGQAKKDALITLVRIGGSESEKVLGEALADPNAEIVRTALFALAEGRGAAHAPRVLRLLGGTREAVAVLDALFAYYRACPEVVGKPVLIGFLRIAEDISAAREARVRILDALGTWASEFDGDTRKEIRVIASSPERELKEAALVLLHVIGDKTARKELLADYDDQIDRNKNWANSYEQRAGILYRIGDFKEAQRDYLQAINLAKNDVRARLDEAYVGLARCYVQQGKLKEAVKTLEKAPVSLKQLGELAREPVFKKLVDDPKLRGVFKLD